MAINSKPFLPSEMLGSISFEGRPYYFNANDFNKQTSLLGYGINNITNFVGAKRDFAISVTNIITDITGDPITLGFDYSSGIGTILYNGVSFAVPALVGHYSFSVAVSSNLPPIPYIILKGDLISKEFGDGKTDSNSLCGISATEYPTLVPSCKITQYENVVLEIVEDPSLVANLICIVARLQPSVAFMTALTYEVIYEAVKYEDVTYAGGAGATIQTNKSVVSDVYELRTRVEGEIESHVANRSNPHVVTRTQLSLDNVPNLDCSDADNITQNILSAFNKDFGTAYADVARGNHIHGYDSRYLGATETAVNSEKLDDHDSTYFAISTHLHTGVYEPVFSKNTGFNKALGTTGGTVSEGNHLHTGVYEAGFSKNSGFNKTLGTIGGTVSEGNHLHTGTYEPAITPATAFNKNFGIGSTDVEKGSNNPDALITKKVDIGDWDMDTDSTANLSWATLGTTINKVVGFVVMIRNDDGTSIRNLNDTISTIVAGTVSATTFGLVLYRTTSQLFDTTDYDSTSYNRGYVILTLLP